MKDKQGYYEVVVAEGVRIPVMANSYEEAKSKAERLRTSGCDAEYCPGGDCRLEHYHVVNCRCADCCEADADYD